MNIDPEQLINGHLDRTLSESEEYSLNEWIKAAPENADRFVNAVMLHNRIHVQYQSQQATQDHFGSVSVAPLPRRHVRSRRATWGTGIACLMLVALLYFRVPNGSNDTPTPVVEFREMMTIAHRPGDRTYQVTFVKEPTETSPLNKVVQNEENTSNRATLYVRNGRQFVYTWTSDGRQTFIGSDGNSSWTYRVGEQLVRSDDPLKFTGGLPGGNLLAPILSLFDGQEKFIVADYNLEVRHPSKTTSVILAGKKPDTKQGDRRAEITLALNTGIITEMRIWPETLDLHKKLNYTLIELKSSERLPGAWFSPTPHLQAAIGRAINMIAHAD